MYNKVILVGNLTRDIELRYSSTGMAIGKFGIATNRYYKDPTTNENKQEVMFIDVTVFGRSAETANQFLKKGSKVLVEGRLSFDTWVGPDGQKRSKHSVIAEKIQFLDSKNSQNDFATPNSGPYQNNYQNNQSQNNMQQPAYQQQNTNNYQQPMQTEKQAEIPSINIDEEEVPF